jgi:hypothetical protein
MTTLHSQLVGDDATMSVEVSPANRMKKLLCQEGSNLDDLQGPLRGIMLLQIVTLNVQLRVGHIVV